MICFYKKRKISPILIFCMLITLLTGCNTNQSEFINNQKYNEGNIETTNITKDSDQISQQISNEDMFSKRDCDMTYDADNAVYIQLDDEKVTATSDAVKIQDGIITLTEEATYVLSGTLSEGYMLIDAGDQTKIQLVLKDAHITSKNNAAIYVKNADKVFITLEGDSENSLITSEEFASLDENNVDGVLFSKSDLTINGQGTLNITSNNGHGIVCKDDFVMTSGELRINAASHGIDANDSVRIKESNIHISSGKDGIHSENNEDESKGFVYMESGSISIESEGDGISAAAYMMIEDGNIDIVAGGGAQNGSKKSSSDYGMMPRDGFGENGQNKPQRPKQMDEGQMPPQRPEQMDEGQTLPQRPEQKQEGQIPPQQPDQVEETQTAEDESTSMKGLKVSGILQIQSGIITIDSADDSVHSNNKIIINGGNLELKTGDDGIHADHEMLIVDGKINISECYEGLEALNIVINGGEIEIVARDDGINAAGGKNLSGITNEKDSAVDYKSMRMPSSNASMVITNGNINIYASGDGLDANGSIEITGGYICSTGPTYGDTGVLDYDTTGTISGGTYIGTGGANMAQNFSEYTQGVIFKKVDAQEAGTVIVVKDQAGKVILEHTPQEDYELVIISSPDLDMDETYMLYIGDNVY